MFVAFTVFGAMPLFGYLLTELLARGATYHFQVGVRAPNPSPNPNRKTNPNPNPDPDPSPNPNHFQLSVLITGFTLFALGTIKSTFGAGE